MKIRFWGVRGSSPTPLTPGELKNKVSSIVMRAKPADVQSIQSKNAFLNSLPDELFSTTGGNTTCVEVRNSENDTFIVDMGTGIRQCEKHFQKEKTKQTLHILLTHFHYDHLLGLPYFGQMYNPMMKIIFYSPYPAMEKILKEYLKPPYHPVGWESFQAKTEFRVLNSKESIKIGRTKIDWIHRKHPNGTIAYSFKENDRKFIFSTDTELHSHDLEMEGTHKDFFKNADVMALDSQYTLGEAVEKYSWGHTSYSMAVDFADIYMIKNLYLFHHEPSYGDSDLASLLRSAKWYYEHKKDKQGALKNIDLAKEGKQIDL